MNALKVRNFLWKNKLTITGMARELELEYDATFDSLRKMLTDLFYKDIYNAKLAAIVKEKYGLDIPAPKKQRTAKTVAQAA